MASDIMETAGEGFSESDTSGENDAAITHSVSAVDPHPEWLKRWKAALNVWRQTEEDTPEANAAWAESEQLSVLLCQTPAHTALGLAAQFEWFKGDLGEYITESVGTTHSCILDVMEDGIARIAVKADAAPDTAKTLSDCQHDAVHLSSLIDGLAILIETVECDGPAFDGAYALVAVIAAQADALHVNLDKASLGRN